MSEFVIMPKEDLVEIGDTTRELSQNNESIVADVLSANLRTAVASVGGAKQ